MRLAAAEEAADPGAALAGLSEIVEERADDLLDAIRVLPLADECLEFAAQLGLRPLVSAVRNPRLALVYQGMGGGIAL